MSSVELIDPRIPEGGTSSWLIYDINTTWIISEKSRLNMFVENLFDINYRAFGSGINAPGRNVNIAYYFSF
jgi:hemoglobin/transferrin/lactoferrin receptor protein